MRTYEATVEGTFKVTVDETKFTEEFLEEFRESFYSFETVDEHVEHLAQLFGRGMVDSQTTFIEGYGPPADMGIKFEHMRPGQVTVEWVDVPVEVQLTDKGPA